MCLHNHSTKCRTKHISDTHKECIILEHVCVCWRGSQGRFVWLGRSRQPQVQCVTYHSHARLKNPRNHPPHHRWAPHQYSGHYHRSSGASHRYWGLEQTRRETEKKTGQRPEWVYAWWYTGEKRYRPSHTRSKHRHGTHTEANVSVYTNLKANVSQEYTNASFTSSSTTTCRKEIGENLPFCMSNARWSH